MEYRVTERGIEIESFAEFNLPETLDCGQCFRFSPEADGAYSGIAMSRRLRISDDGVHIVFEGVTEEEFLKVWVPYFDLDFDYGAVRCALAESDTVMRQAAAFAPGMRILRQDPWEALCSFILSQNNNIKRIKGLVSRLCEHFGEPMDGGYDFPKPEALAGLSEADLAPVRCGFRAAYVLDAARRVANGEINFEQLKFLPMEEARKMLMTIKGVGPKVAECALLYGLHRLDAFPVDVWIRRAMDKLYPNTVPEQFGEYAGIAQQYLFHYCRMNPELLKEDECKIFF